MNKDRSLLQNRLEDTLPFYRRKRRAEQGSTKLSVDDRQGTRRRAVYFIWESRPNATLGPGTGEEQPAVHCSIGPRLV